MTTAGWVQLVAFVALLTATVPLVGGYMARVFSGEPVALDRVLGPVERALYRLLGTRPDSADRTGAATRARRCSSTSPGFVLLYLILRTQGVHPWNPQGLGAPPWDLSFNTAASFVTNTNWQFYGGETTLSYFSQMAGLAVQNFLSAAVGIAVCVAVIRGFAARSTRALGNFWVDLTRALLYVLLSRSRSSLALFLVSQGAIQTLGPYATLRHARRRGADARARAGRLSGDHQGARHERRRLLQRQRRDAVREPDGPDQLLPHADDPAHPGRR